jgi:hypothetical protein
VLTEYWLTASMIIMAIAPATLTVFPRTPELAHCSRCWKNCENCGAEDWAPSYRRANFYPGNFLTCAGRNDKTPVHRLSFSRAEIKVNHSRHLRP